MKASTDPCLDCGRQRKIIARRLCGGCYNRRKRAGTRNELPTNLSLIQNRRSTGAGFGGRTCLRCGGGHRRGARGLCFDCYYEARRRGTIDAYPLLGAATTSRARADHAERFWSKVAVQRPAECWPWVGRTNKRGYARFHYGPIHELAHRFVHELIVGAIPAGMTVDHLCSNTSCMNPAHLEVVTRAENSRRRWRRIRAA